LDNNIHPLYLPAHSTHILQELDVGLFSPLQRAYSTELDHWMRHGGNPIKKGQFMNTASSLNDIIPLYNNLIPDW
jgi:hypothetical protein